MDKTPLFSLDSHTSTGSTSGPGCNGVHSPTPLLYGFKLGPSGLRHRRPVSGLDPAGGHISVFSGQLSPESTAQSRSFRIVVALVAPKGQEGYWYPLLLDPRLCPLPIPSSELSQLLQLRLYRLISVNEKLDFWVSQGSLPNIAWASNQSIWTLLSQINLNPLFVNTTRISEVISLLRSTKPKEMSIYLALSFSRSLHDSGLAVCTVTSTKSILAWFSFYGLI